MKSLLHILVFLGVLCSASGQPVLPVVLSPPEVETDNLLAVSKELRDAASVPMPPPPPVRAMAEWEEVQAVVITWDTDYTPILTEVVRHSRKECRVIIITNQPELLDTFLRTENIPPDNIEFIEAGFNSVWIRDYGPWAVYHNDVDSLMIVDWIYDDSTRTRDDTLSRRVAERLGLPIYEAIEPPYDWVHAGGNNLQDGMGSLFSSGLVLETNPGKTWEEIAAIARAFLGIIPGRYFTLPTLPYDSIHHLDMHMRFMDEETILVGQYPEGVADGPQIEENVGFLQQLTTAFGNPYAIIRILMPPDALGRYPDENGFYRTYTNGIFVNKTYLLPVYEEQYDTTALRIHRELLPGYTIVGIDCDGIVDNFGAIHCIAKLVGVRDPLRIAHARLRDTENTSEPYPVKAIVQHRSGIAGATLYYRVLPDSSYTAVPMALEDEQASLWAGTIPAQPVNTEVQYYIHATAHSGKEQVRPMVAPEGYFRFRMLGPSGADEQPHRKKPLGLDIYPNPAVDLARLRFTAAEPQKACLELFNLQGQRVWSKVQYLPQGESEVLLPAGGLASGVYHLSVTDGEGRIGRALVVRK